jgi:hypothetical protein
VTSPEVTERRKMSRVEQIAKIRSTHLGYEDHGIFTAYLDLDYGGSGQSAGGYALDEYVDDLKGRYGTSGGMDFIIGVLKACGVSTWEKVAGRTLIALREEDYHGKVIGLKPLPTEGGETFIFSAAFPVRDPEEVVSG